MSSRIWKTIFRRVKRPSAAEAGQDPEGPLLPTNSEEDGLQESQPYVHPLLMPHVLEAVFKNVPFNSLKDCRLVCQYWCDVVTESMEKEDTCKVTIISKDKYKGFWKCFKKIPKLPFTTYEVGWHLLCEGDCDKFIKRFGSTMKTIILLPSGEDHIPIDHVIKLLGTQSIDVEDLSLKVGVTCTKTSAAKCLSQATNYSAVSRTSDIVNLDFPKNSKLKSFQQLGPFFLSRMYYQEYVEPYQMFLQDFFRSTIALETLNLSSYNSPSVRNRGFFDRILASGVMKTVKFLTLGLVDSDLLLLISRNEVQLLGFKAIKSYRVLPRGWYAFLSRQNNLEFLEIKDFDQVILPPPPQLFIFNLPRMRYLKSLTFMLLPQRPQLTFMSRLQFDLSLTCPNLTMLKLFSVPASLMLPGNINSQITSLDLQETVTGSVAIRTLAQQFPGLEALSVTISNTADMPDVWVNFWNLKKLSLTLKLGTLVSDFDTQLNGEYDQNEGYEQPLDPWKDGPWKILQRDTPSILYLQHLQSLRIRVQFRVPNNYSYRPPHNLFGKRNGDTGWYIALTQLPKLRDVELVNIALTEDCRRRIIKETGIWNLKLTSVFCLLE